MTAKNAFACIIVIAVLATPVPGLAQSSEVAAPAQSSEVAAPVPANLSAGTSMTVVSAYVWRGFLLADEPSLQPTAWVTVGGLTVSSWFNMSATGESRPLNEHDLTVDYTHAIGAWRTSVGYINYFFPTASSGRFSDEFYAGVSRPGTLNPFVKVFADVHEGSGTYVSSGVSQTRSVGSISLTPSVALGYNHQQWVDGSGFSDLNVGIQAAWTGGGGHVSIAPFVCYSRSFRPEWFPSKSYGGVTITVR